MKMIVAIIRPEKLDDVKKRLEEIGIISMTISKVQGKGVNPLTLISRAKSIQVDFIEKIQLMLVVSADKANACIDAISEAAKSDRGRGDGKIFVIPVEDAIRIRTGEHSKAAI